LPSLPALFGQDEVTLAANVQQYLDDLRRDNLVIVR